MRRRLPDLLLAALAVLGVLSWLATALQQTAAQQYARHGATRLALLALRDALDPQLSGALLLGLAVWLGSRLLGLGSTRDQRPVGRWTAAAALALYLAVHAAALIGAHRATPAGPAVVLIVVDSLRRDRLGCYGHDGGLTPALDAFAARATRYTAAYSTAPWTTPSVGSMLTGRYASQLGVVDRAVALPAPELTLAEHLREHGYRTGAVVSHTLLSAALGFDQGFESFDEGGIGARDGVTGAEVTARGLRWLERRGDDPHLLLLHYFDPHYDYVLHPIHTPTTDYDGPIRSGQPIFAQRELAPQLGAESTAYLRSIYDSEVRYTDARVGELLDGMAASGQLDDALVIVTADHGEALIERGDPWIGHTRTLYQELIHVPLLIKWPGQASGATVDRVVSLAELLPTIAAATGTSLPTSYAGVPGSLHPDATPATSPRAFAETQKDADLCAVVAGDLKLIVDWRGGGARLYELATDPGETTDVAGEYDELVERLVGEARAWTAHVRDGAPRAAPIEPMLTREQRRRLEELGYL